MNIIFTLTCKYCIHPNLCICVHTDGCSSASMTVLQARALIKCDWVLPLAWQRWRWTIGVFPPTAYNSLQWIWRGWNEMGLTTGQRWVRPCVKGSLSCCFQCKLKRERGIDNTVTHCEINLHHWSRQDTEDKQLYGLYVCVCLSIPHGLKNGEYWV